MNVSTTGSLKTCFARNKNRKIVFFDCDWFDPNHCTQENKFLIVEVKHAHRLRGCDPFVLAHQVKQVYYMSYPCEKLSAWWVVYRVRLHTSDEKLMRFIKMMNHCVHLI
jgi:hypothetical protein